MFAINATISNLAIITVTTMLVSNLPRRQGRQKRVSVPVEKFFWIPVRGGRTKNLYTKSVTLTRTCRVIWACPEKVQSTNNEKQKHMKHSLDTVMYTAFPTSLPLVSTACVARVSMV
jgi:hypothetical protein